MFMAILCSLCRSQWRHVSAYRKQGSSGFSFKKLYMQLDEATLTFNADVSLVNAALLLTYLVSSDAFSVLTLLVGHQGKSTQPRKYRVMRCWCGYLT